MIQDSLLRRIHDSDPKALNEFVQNELPRVFNLCLRLCQNKSEAEDLCQDVFTKAISGIKNFKGQTYLDATRI